MLGMLRKSRAFVPRYQKFESISLQRRVVQTIGSAANDGDVRAMAVYLKSLGEGSPLGAEVSGIPAPESSLLLSFGQTVYDTHCASCHAKDGRGSRATRDLLKLFGWGIRRAISLSAATRWCHFVVVAP